MSEKKAPLYTVIDSFNFEEASKKLLATRKVENDGDVITYTEISQNIGDKTLKLRGAHVSYTEIHKMANNRCNTCVGKGYYISNVSKSALKDPVGHMVLEEEIPSNFSDEQKKIWQAKIDKTPTWRIVNNCGCAVDKFLRKNYDVLANSTRTIFIRIDYDIVPLELVTEEPKKIEAPVEAPVEAPSTNTEPKNIYVDANTSQEPKQD